MGSESSASSIRCLEIGTVACGSGYRRGRGPPHGAQRWEIGSFGVRSGVAFFFAFVAVPSPVILVRDDSPAPIGQRPVREYAELLDGVDASGANGAQVFPAVAEVELVDELLVVLEPSQGDSSPVQDVLVFVVPVGSTYPDAVSKVELMQVGAVPACEGVIDGSGQLGKGVAAGGCQNTARSWPQVLASSADEVNADRQPGTTHSRMLSDSSRPAYGRAHPIAWGVPTKGNPCARAVSTGVVVAASGYSYLVRGELVDEPVLPGVVRIDARTATRVLTLPGGEYGHASFPNGLAFSDDLLYVSDSAQGSIWRTRPHGTVKARQHTAWLTSPLLAPVTNLGVNSIAVDRTGINAVNADRGSVVRIPVKPNGRPSQPALITQDPKLVTADGVTLDGQHRLWVVTNSADGLGRSLLRVDPDGQVTTVADNPGWLDYPTQPIFGTTHTTHDTLFIANGAFNTGTANVIALASRGRNHW
jgi:sugar lactone lactonase YvrE